MKFIRNGILPACFATKIFLKILPWASACLVLASLACGGGGGAGAADNSKPTATLTVDQGTTIQPLSSGIVRLKDAPSGGTATWQIVAQTSSAQLISTAQDHAEFLPTTNQLGTFQIQCNVNYPSGASVTAQVEINVVLKSATDGNLAYPRYEHIQTALGDGRPLVSGGVVMCNGGAYFPSAEVYDPGTRHFRQTTGYMQRARRGYTVTPLLDGTLLLAGGFDGGPPGMGLLHDSEIYDPATDAFQLVAAPLTTGHSDHCACRLLDGRVLVVGGVVGDSLSTAVLPSAEIFDPGTKTWNATKGLPNFARRFGHCERLPNGQVLVFGGRPFLGSDLVGQAELFDPQTGEFTLASEMMVPRLAFSTVVLGDGRILILGGLGDSGVCADVEIYDPGAGTFRLVSPMAQARCWFTATPIAGSDDVLLAGGGDPNSYTLSSLERYNPVIGTSELLPASLSVSVQNLAASSMADGTIILTGGINATGAGPSNLVQIFNPSNNTLSLNQ